MATSVLSIDNLEFKNASSQSLCKMLATADTLTLSGNGGDVEIRGVATPTQANSVPSKQYVDSLAQGIDWKNSVRAATTAAGTLATSFANGSVIDGVTLATDDRILIKNQANGVENGIYTVQSSGAPTRAVDMAASSAARASACFIEEGSVNADQSFLCTNNTGSDVVGTDALVFVQISGAGQIEAGSALTKNGNTLNVAVDDASIQITSDQLNIKAAGVQNSMLANSSVTVTAGNALSGGGAVALGASVNLDVSVDGSTIEVSTDSLQVKDLGITNAKLAGSIANAKLVNDNIDIVSGDGLNTTSQNIALGASATLSVDSTVVRTSGNQGIGGIKTFSDATDASSSTVGGTVFSGGIAVAKAGYYGGSVTAVSHVSTSDERKKSDITEVKDAGDKIDKIKPVYFKWVDQSVDTFQHCGILAQEVKKVVPECVREDAKGYLSVEYQHLFMLLLKDHQELKQSHKELSKKIAELEAKN